MKERVFTLGEVLDAIEADETPQTRVGGYEWKGRYCVIGGAAKVLGIGAPQLALGLASLPTCSGLPHSKLVGSLGSQFIDVNDSTRLTKPQIAQRVRRSNCLPLDTTVLVSV